MDFSVFALACVPDVATARRVLAIDDLDDKSVAKVLFHRRKQQPGAPETLRWDQQAVAASTLIRHRDGRPEITSMSLDGRTEPGITDRLLSALGDAETVVVWDGRRSELATIRFRALMHGQAIPPALHDDGQDRQRCVDVAAWLAAPGDEPVGLDVTARKLGLPGVLNGSDSDSVDAWLRDDYAAMQSDTGLRALNTYLIALRLFAATGEIIADERQQAERRLRESLDSVSYAFAADFRSAWGC